LALSAVFTLVFCTGSGNGRMPLTTGSSEALEQFEIGREYLGNLRTVQALPHFEEAVKIDPEFAVGYLYIALATSEAKGFFQNLDRAESLSDKVSKGERLLIDSWVAAAEGETVRRRELLLKLVELFPEDREARMTLANQYFTQQEYELGIAEYEAIVTRWPDFAPPYNMLGYCYRSLDNYESAGNAFEKYIELIPDDPNPYDSYAEMLTRAGKFEEAIEYYRKALEVSPIFVLSRIGIVHNLIFLDRHEDALAELALAYEKAVDYGQRRNAVFARVTTLVDKGDLDGALEGAAEMLELDSAMADSTAMSGSLGVLAQLNLWTGEFDKAESSLRRSLGLIEEARVFERVKRNARVDFEFGMAQVLLERGNLSEARKRAETYLTTVEPLLNPFRIRNAHSILGRLSLAEGNYERAISELLQADQQQAWTLFHLARAYEGNGQMAEALEFYRSAANMYQFNSLGYARIRARAAAKATELAQQVSS
jgi:tetratricopeptide (TPR) repeat protein